MQGCKLVANFVIAGMHMVKKSCKQFHFGLIAEKLSLLSKFRILRYGPRVAALPMRSMKRDPPDFLDEPLPKKAG